MGRLARRPSELTIKAGWAILAVGLAIWLVAWLAFDPRIDSDSFPAPQDPLYIAAFAAFALGVVVLARAGTGTGRFLWLDAGLTATSVGSLVTALVWHSHPQGAAGVHATWPPSLAYPLIAATLCLIVLSLAATAPEGRRMWLLLGGAFACAGGASVNKARLLELPGGVTIALGAAFVALFVAAALASPRPGARRQAQPDSLSGLLIPVLLGLYALGVLIWDHFHPTGLAAVTLAGITLLGILARLMLTIVESRRRDASELAMMGRVANAERLSAIGRLAGAAAHDFNNVLSIIAGYADVAAGTPEMPDQARDDLGRIGEAVQRGAALTDELLRLSRGETLPPEPVPVDALVAELAPLLQRTLDRRARLGLSLAADGAEVRLPPGQLDRVLINLVANSRDALDDGGRVTISTRRERRPNGAESVALRVEDDGEGMEPEVASRAFEPFFTTKAPESGTGVGLASVGSIVKAAGGTARLTSQPRAGTTVELELPC